MRGSAIVAVEYDLRTTVASARTARLKKITTSEGTPTLVPYPDPDRIAYVTLGFSPRPTNHSRIGLATKTEL